MVKKRDNEARMFHLSYDKKNSEIDGETLRMDITIAALNIDLNVILMSPVESTILIESHKNFEFWESFFQKKYEPKMFYVLSEVRQNEESYIINWDINEELNSNYVKKVEALRAEFIRKRKLMGL
ncbi:MAG: hypothetical protein COA31_005455 [Flavobacteriales bacterium]|nr:hypothetical protein [Flavobacteriales bacterium]